MGDLVHLVRVQCTACERIVDLTGADADAAVENNGAPPCAECGGKMQSVYRGMLKPVGDTSEVPAENARHAFTNRVRSLYNIDKSVIDAALRGIGEPPLDIIEWERFRDDPPRFLIRADQPTATVIWRCIEARQRNA